MKKQKNIEEQAERCLLDAEGFFEMKIIDAMKRRAWDMPLIDKDREIFDVFALLSTNDHVWVIDNLKSKRVLGIITEHDILHALKPIKSHRFFGVPSRKGLGLSLFETAEHIMTHHPFTCTPEEKVVDILHTMEAHGIRRMPVVDPDNEQIVSEVTVHQLIRRYYEIIKPLCGLNE
jgi:CBS domain-containing protein